MGEDLRTVSSMQLSGAPRFSKKIRRQKLDAPVAEVLCDDSGRLGSLSYEVPATMSICIGDAVRVPFGKQERYGMVVGPGDRSKATRPVLECFGPRTGETEIALAAELATEHFVPFASIAPRLAPRTRRGNPPASTQPVSLRTPTTPAELGLPTHDPAHPRKILAIAPALDPFRVAAVEVRRLSQAGQVLVLCPTTRHVEMMYNEFLSGAARMDVVPGKDETSAWRGFLEGSVHVAIATRTAALWPAADLAGIVVLDESHPGHVESAQPHTNARDVAIRRTSATGAELVLIATVPSLHALGSHSKLVSVGRPRHWPTALFANRTELDPHARLTPPAALNAVAAARRTKHPAYVLAPHSSSKWRCMSCKAAYQNLLSTCTKCSGVVKPSGFGPDRVAALFTKATPLSLAELYRSRPKPGSTVVIFDGDALASTPDLEPEWTCATALYAAARLAGEGGTVVVCVDKEVPATALDVLLHKDPRRHARRVWAVARASSLPPFTKRVDIRFKRTTAPKLPALDARVLGPRRSSDGEWETTLLVDPAKMHTLAPWVDRLRRSGKVRITVS